MAKPSSANEDSIDQTVRVLEVAKYSVPQSDIDNWGTPLGLTSSSAGVVDEKSLMHSSRCALIKIPDFGFLANDGQPGSNKGLAEMVQSSVCQAEASR
jgi:hypothetical protein